MTITKTVDELMDEMKTTKQELDIDDNPVSTLIGEAMDMLQMLFTSSNLKQYRAFVKNEDTKKEYNLVIFAEDETSADRKIYDIFDDFFYNEETEEQDMYSHRLEEIKPSEGFTDIPECTPAECTEF